jgi:hypothetical protein
MHILVRMLHRICARINMMLCFTHQASVLGWQPDSHLSYTPPSSSGSVCTSALFLLYLTGHEGAVCCAEAVLLHSASTVLASISKRKRPRNPAINKPEVLFSAYSGSCSVSATRKACAPRAVQYCSTDLSRVRLRCYYLLISFII